MILLVCAILAVHIGSTKAKKLKASWALCAGEDARECPYGKYGNISNEIFPDTIPVGANFSIIAVGYSLQQITSPSMSWHLVDGTLMDTTIKDEACGKHEYIMPLGNGEVYYEGTKCPMVVGPVNITFVANINSLGWHTDGGSASLTFKLYDKPDQQGNCVQCSVTTFTMTG
eukprot:UN04944